MTEPLHRPTETPPVEGSTAEAHEERPDGGVWEHPYVWLGLVVAGIVITAAFFLLRSLDLLTPLS
ncbi:hypothetical protein N4P33_10915 [Streptomyces sp. 15-116A]|uniref:hypothetical protein n=1 Tax=Streptomyces sp. 15-116A TaxID=2259035 RepID=UPI0021B2FA27|nr:hypothetical protein [Streptomyces sp. 15-116A]MCT7352680.1 hypothetical protein [Streptomyces sp. 15-116A]